MNRHAGAVVIAGSVALFGGNVGDWIPAAVSDNSHAEEELTAGSCERLAGLTSLVSPSCRRRRWRRDRSRLLDRQQVVSPSASERSVA